MFLDTGDSGLDYLAPAQSTPFITGILGRPDGNDANGHRPGGGGVTSFGFASEPDGTDGDLVKIEQDRQWALTDSIGTSSAFFAETLQNLFATWFRDIDRFFADIDKVAEELEDWLRTLLSELGFVGKIAGLLFDGIAEATQGARTDRLKRLEKVFDSVDLGRQELAKHFRELSIQALIPGYGYWPVDDPAPASGFKDTRFADGGNGDIDCTRGTPRRRIRRCATIGCSSQSPLRSCCGACGSEAATPPNLAPTAIPRFVPSDWMCSPIPGSASRAASPWASSGSITTAYATGTMSWRRTFRPYWGTSMTPAPSRAFPTTAPSTPGSIRQRSTSSPA